MMYQGARVEVLNCYSVSRVQYVVNASGHALEPGNVVRLESRAHRGGGADPVARVLAVFETEKPLAWHVTEVLS